jgi:bla regulator protein blaR1
MTATQLVEVLVSYSLQVLIVLVCGKLLERAVVRPTDRCAVWNTCFLSILFLGSAALLLPRLHLFRPWALVGPHGVLAVTSVQAAIGRVLLAVWSIGVSLLLLRWVLRSYALRRSLCRCEQLPKQEVQRLMAIADSEVADRHLPIVLITDDADGPYCHQLHRPTIVLPRFLFEGDREDVHNVIIHEMEHLKTNHPLQLFTQQLAQVVCWFHPAVWKAGWHAALTREYACDDAAAAQGANSAAYLRTLLHIAERCEQNNHGSAIGFGRSPSEIVLRAQRLVLLTKEPNKQTRGALGIKTALCLLLLVTIVVSQLWLPTDPLASSRAFYSPWPSWTAEVFHSFGHDLRDFEQYDRRVQIHELQLSDVDAIEGECETLAANRRRR